MTRRPGGLGRPDRSGGLGPAVPWTPKQGGDLLDDYRRSLVEVASS